MPPPPTVTCDLTGGLGNQLFILCATLAYAYEHDLPVAFPRFEGTHGVDGSARPAYWDTLFRALAPLLRLVADAHAREQRVHVGAEAVEAARERAQLLERALPPQLRDDGESWLDHIAAENKRGVGVAGSSPADV